MIMKRNPLFEKLLSQVPQSIKEEVGLSFDIAKRIHDLLNERGLSQKEFAKKMGKSASEISKWMSGTHNFTIKTIADISEVLGETILQVKKKQNDCFYINQSNFFKAKKVSGKHNISNSTKFVNTQYFS